MAKFFLLLAVSMLATLSPSLQAHTSEPVIGPSVHLTNNKTVLETGEQTVLHCEVRNLVPNAPFRVTFFREGSHEMYWYTVSHEKGVWTSTATKRGNFLDLDVQPIASEWPVYNLGVVAKTAVKHTYTCELYAEPHGKEGTFVSNHLEITAKAHK